MNILQVCLGVFSLILGAAFYVCARPAGTTYFIPEHFNQLQVFSQNSYIYYVFPSFIHTLAFILLTVGWLGCKTRVGILWVTLFWLLIDISFEALQHPMASNAVIGVIPDWFDHFFLLENTTIYLQTGRFDYFDLCAATLGAFTAYFITIATTTRGK